MTATARLQRKQLERLKLQIELCELRAPADGTVVYLHEQKNPLELGVAVRFKQKLFKITNMSQMQANVYVHEADVKKVKLGAAVEVQVDAFPNLTLHGTVREVANFYDTTRHWLSGGVKEYQTVVSIEELPGAGLKPGMTAQVKIKVGLLTDSLLVPMPAVVERNEKHYCYVVGAEGIQRRPVSIGDNTENFVEIKKGLSQDEIVALDARHRSASELEDEPTEENQRSNEPIAMVDSR